MRKASRAPRRRQRRLEWPTGPSSAYLAAWMALTPGERLRRAWALRRRLRDPQAAHDAKTFRSFERFGLDCLLISGQAAILYGAATFSEDVDIWIRPTLENATRLLRALAACQGRVYKLTPALTRKNLMAGHGFHFGIPARPTPVYLDVMGRPPRVGPYRQARAAGPATSAPPGGGSRSWPSRT